jgi:hypothetical protein
MGNFFPVSTFIRQVKRSGINFDATSISEENYQVKYDLTADVKSSLWLSIKNRRKRNRETNRIRTTRYNIITFLPKNLFDQFHRAANIYFAILIGINWIPVLTGVSQIVSKLFLN